MFYPYFTKNDNVTKDQGGKLMKRLLSIVTVFLLSLGVVLAPASASVNTSPEKQTKEVSLSQEQKTELSKLHKELFEKKKEIVNKYIEYGVFSEEKGKKILGKMESRLKELEENEYLPKWERHKHHHQHN
jgi:hypothetical protein